MIRLKWTDWQPMMSKGMDGLFYERRFDRFCRDKDEGVLMDVVPVDVE